MTVSIIFPPIAVFEIGLKSDRDFGGLILGIGVISAFLYSSGNVPEYMDLLTIILYGNASSI